MNRIIVIFPILILFMFSCETHEADVPAYVQIDSVKFVTNSSLQGTNKQQITDVWFNLEGSKIGAFEIPTRFPVIAEGKRAVTMYAGILKNGILNFREKYPFVESVKDTLNFSSTEIIFPDITFKYKDNLEFWIEDFEDPGLKFHTVDSTNYLIQVRDSNDAENSLGRVYLPQNTSSFLFYTKEHFLLSYNPIFMEIEYKCTADFSIGVLVENIDGSYETVNPFTIIKESNDWNKLYINLAEQFALSPSGKSYDVYFFFANDVGITDVYLDNIKIITYQ